MLESSILRSYLFFFFIVHPSSVKKKGEKSINSQFYCCLFKLIFRRLYLDVSSIHHTKSLSDGSLNTGPHTVGGT